MIADFHSLISPDVGIIHRADEGLVPYDHPRIASWFAQACDIGRVLGAGPPGNTGGAAAGRQDARQAAIGEAVERYSACHMPESQVRLAREADLLDDAMVVGPDWRDGLDVGETLHWVRGSLLRSRATAIGCWLPAHRVYLNGIDDDRGIWTATSNGLACHTDPWRALRSALLEVIERDAVMVSWHTRSAVTKIECDLRWQDVGRPSVRFDLAVESYSLYLLDSPLDIPVVLAVARGSRGQPAAAVGAAANPRLHLAARKALIECQQTFAWARLMLAEDRPIPDAHEITELEQHVAHYVDPAHLGAFDYLERDFGRLPVRLTLTDPGGPPQDPRRDVDDLLDRAAAAGLDCCCVDVTAPDVREAGAWVVRAVVPGLYPLTVGAEHRMRHPRVAGRLPVIPTPHPFP